MLVHLEAENTKTKRRRAVPLNREAREAIGEPANFPMERCPDTRWVFAHEYGSRINAVRRGFRTACRGAGTWKIYGTRAPLGSFQTEWLWAEVLDLLGHATVAMTERYAHAARENVRAAVLYTENGVTIWSR